MSQHSDQRDSRVPFSATVPQDEETGDYSEYYNNADDEYDLDQAEARGGQRRPSIKQRLSATAQSIQDMVHHRTDSGGVASVLPIHLLSPEQLNEMAKLSAQQARVATKQGWMQTTLAGRGALRGLLEIERMVEMIMLGALHKYSSTAFVTFKSRVTESIAQQMLLSHDAMEINHAPNPHDIIWDNIAIPKSQVVMRSYITNVGIVVGSIFWSSLVNSVNVFASWVPLPAAQQQIASAGIMLLFLMVLPYIFDSLARYYEGMKLESEIQNAIMTRYFYYQLINVYVTVGFSGNNLWGQIITALQKPQTLVDVIGGRMPHVSLFFTNLMIVKVLTAIPLEMIRPWQLSTIHLMGNCMNRRKTTRRDLRTGVFYSWPMLYGWIYPQLMMVLMIMVTYCCITPLLSPFGVVFFALAYWMYKYQLLYVYINEYQSGGFMWYAVFHYSMVSMEFASVSLVGYLSLQLKDPQMSGPFFFTLPLPFCLLYFGSYCEQKFRKQSMNLSYGFAKTLDTRNEERAALGKSTPYDTFTKTCYRQPSLTETNVYPEPYRNDGSYLTLLDLDHEESVVTADWQRKNRRGSLSINVHELTDEGEEDPRVLELYFRDVVLPLSKVPKKKRRKHRRPSTVSALHVSRHSVDGGVSDSDDDDEDEDEDEDYEYDEEEVGGGGVDPHLVDTATLLKRQQAAMRGTKKDVTTQAQKSLLLAEREINPSKPTNNNVNTNSTNNTNNTNNKTTLVSPRSSLAGTGSHTGLTTPGSGTGSGTGFNLRASMAAAAAASATSAGSDEEEVEQRGVGRGDEESAALLDVEVEVAVDVEGDEDSGGKHLHNKKKKKVKEIVTRQRR